MAMSFYLTKMEQIYKRNFIPRFWLYKVKTAGLVDDSGYCYFAFLICVLDKNADHYLTLLMRSFNDMDI